jgi:T4-like virus tail tube protein gp19
LFLVLENAGFRAAHAVRVRRSCRRQAMPSAVTTRTLTSTSSSASTASRWPASATRFAGDPALFEWWRDVAQGTLARRDVSIVLLDEQRQEVARWNLSRAWPVTYVAPDLRGLGNEVAIETRELFHEGLELE